MAGRGIHFFEEKWEHLGHTSCGVATHLLWEVWGHAPPRTCFKMVQFGAFCSIFC